MNVSQLIVIALILIALISGELFSFLLGTLAFPIICYGLFLVGLAPTAVAVQLVLYLVTLAGIFFLTREFNAKTGWFTLFGSERYIAGALFAGVFSYSIFLSAFRWPDFFPMGERLRDFALLASSLRNPFGAAEPWMAGYDTNYYLYWYRLFGLFGNMLGLTTPLLYHIAISFALTLYACSIFFLLRALSVKNRFILSFVPLIVVFGSNLAGMQFWLTSDSNWWGPSRVIKGAIDEFPAWSFLLGDLHPHVMDLGILGLSATILLFGLRSKNVVTYVTGILFSCVYVSLFLYGANAWEVPLVFCVSMSLIVACASLKQFPNTIAFNARNITLLGLLVVASIITVAANKQIHPEHYPWTYVSDAIGRTTMTELFGHFGLPLILLMVTVCMRAEKFRGVWFACFLILISLAPAYLLLAAVFLSVLMLAFGQREFFPQRAMLALTAVGLLLVIVPEFIFLDDPYGGENERMNTIFKFYMPAWTLLHVGCITLFIETIQPSIKRFNLLEKTVLGAIAVILPFGFFFAVQPFRLTESPKQKAGVEGLKNLEAQYSGSEATVKKLRSLPDGIVLEGQGDAYSWTTHVTTLAEKTSYLGWVNHVRLLLTKAGDEITRREKVTTDVYQDLPDCAAIKKVLTDENIMYVVFGPREQEKYTASTSDRFSCLSVVVSEGRYAVYKN